MTSRILIIGAGGHGQVIADSLRQMIRVGSDLELVGFLDDDSAHLGKRVLGLPVLGSRKDLRQIPHDAILLAVGDNSIRRELYLELKAEGEQFTIAVHPRATVADDVTLGPGCVVMAGAIVNAGTLVGDNVILNTNCAVEHDCSLAAHVHVAPGSQLGGNVSVGEGGLIGLGATVMPGRKVGAWSTVGAAALAHVDVPDGKTLVGVPGRLME
jgi:sugar O-acyltransferase (sialic acid O-acetyltransferase NeuD family)